MEEMPKTKEIENKRENRVKRIVILILILIVVTIIICCFVVSRKDKEMVNTKNINADSYREYDLETDSSGIKETISNDAMLEIVKNPDYNMSIEINFSRADIIKAYVFNCNNIKNLKSKIACLDEYFYNNVVELKAIRDGCKDSDSAYSTCIDNYYFEASKYGYLSYCKAISSKSLKEECYAGN